MRRLDLPPLWLALCLLAAWFYGRHVGWPQFGLWGDLLGGAFTVAGIALIVAAAVEFRRYRTSIMPHEWPSTIITTGIYRWSRNPIYLADLLLLIGLSLIWDALPGLLLVPALGMILKRRFILPEEARLKTRFRDAFGDYSARTRRWI